LCAAFLLLAIGAQVAGEGAVAALPPEASPSPEATDSLAASEAPEHPASPYALLLGGAGLLALVVSLAVLVRAYGVEGLRQERSFGLMALILGLMLPQLAAFPLELLAPHV